jgi:small subunit ribosomal protein S7
MSRRKAAPKRYILPDPLFGSQLIATFINVVMRRGKKSVAEKIVYGALDKLIIVKGKSQEKKDESEGGEGGESGGGSASGFGSIKNSSSLRKIAVEQFQKVLDTVRPTVEVKSRRVGGATYQVPVEVKQDRGIALAMRWIVEAAKARHEKSMPLRLAGEFLDALENKGGSIKKREDTHRMAKANQAFAHYRW